MAYEIDPMGYYTGLGGSDYSLGSTGVETEEERQRRLRLEAEKNTPVKQTITTDPVTGAQTVKIEGSAHNLSAANPYTPTINQPVVPDESAAETARLRRQEQTAAGVPVAAVAPTRSLAPSTNIAGGYVPAVPGAAYNQYIAQNESGANPNIGYHNQARSTAYGPYGITASAYQDARRLNPALPEDITKATPEQQTAAQNAFTQQNAKYLQSYGIEPTANNLAAAHFLGARGLSDYLKTGAISPMAAAANGGEEKVRQIVQQRLGGAPAPASGAVTETAALATPSNQPVNPYAMTVPSGQGLKVPGVSTTEPAAGADAVSRYTAIQDSPAELLAYAQDTNNPEWMRNRAQSRLMDQYNRQVAQREAQTQFNEMVKNGDTKGITNALQGRGSKGEEGSYLKMIALSFISPQLAGAEAVKLGLAPTKWEDTTLNLPDGREVGVQIERSANGRVLQGTRTDGTPLTASELEIAQTGAMPKGVHVTRVDHMINPQNPNQVITKQILSNGKERYLSGGSNYTGEKGNLVMAQQFTEQENRRVNQAYTNLAKTYSNPNNQQKAQALQDAGVSVYRIESELGLAPGALGAGKGRTSGTPEPTTVPVGTSANKLTAGQTQTVLENPYERPVQREGESNKTFESRIKDWENKNKLQTKAAEGFAEKAVDIRSTLDKFRQGIDIIDNGPHNLGPNFSVSGAGPLPKVQQFFGEQFGTDGAANTQLLRSLITRGGLEGIKNYMGPAISNFDVQTWMKNNPITESSPPAAIKAWLEKTYRAMYDAAEMQRKNAERLGMIDPTFTLGSVPGETTESNKPAAGGQIREGQTSTSKSGRPIIFRNGKWEYQ